MDQDSTVDSRAKRIEDLLYIIGGCEVAIRNNRKQAYVASYGQMFENLKQQYLKKLERLMNGLNEDAS